MFHLILFLLIVLIKTDWTDQTDGLEDCYRCGSGVCIPENWVCDGHFDCKDHRDEENCARPCQSSEFMCTNGQCIQRAWMCDDDYDCVDNSDEVNCTHHTCTPIHFLCLSGECIPKKWECDGVDDCNDKSDESHCSDEKKFKPCLNSEFSCHNKKSCISKGWVCDGTEDCPDGSDEIHCSNKPCPKHKFQCISGECISIKYHCDGDYDCKDQSDEQNCTVANTTSICYDGHYKCGNGQCISIDDICSGKAECLGEDNLAHLCNVNECNSTNGGCSDICVDTAIGYHCTCRAGYKLIGNYTCVDIDECDNPGACSQFCHNYNGTFNCTCKSGYLPEPFDNTKCKATNNHIRLLYSGKHDIRLIPVDHSHHQEPRAIASKPTTVDFHFANNEVFWSDDDYNIYKMRLDPRSQKTEILKGSIINRREGLAVDWLYDHVYWTDTGTKTIEMADLDGKMIKTLISDHLNEPRSIAVDPMNGWMYWSDWGVDANIARAGLDGSHREKIVSYDIQWPNGITLDLIKERVFWVDAKLNMISSVKYDGSNRITVLKSYDTLHRPYSISVFEDYMYWSDLDKHAVFRANKFNGMNVTQITPVNKHHYPIVVRILHSYRQPTAFSQCELMQRNCSHLCLPTPQVISNYPYVTCACPNGLTLLENNKTCHGIVIKNSLEENQGRNASLVTLVIIVLAAVSLSLLFLSLITFVVYHYYVQKNIGNVNYQNPVFQGRVEGSMTMSNLQAREDSAI